MTHCSFSAVRERDMDLVFLESIVRPDQCERYRLRGERGREKGDWEEFSIYRPKFYPFFRDDGFYFGELQVPNVAKRYADSLEDSTSEYLVRMQK